MTDKNAELLQDLVQVASDSRNFYRAAAEAVELPFLKHQFTHMAEAKDALIAELAVHIAARGGEADSGGTIAGSLRQSYAELLAALSQKPAATYTYAAQLEEAEDRLLRHFDQALVDTDSMSVRAVLLTELPKLRQSHDRMKQLKDTLAA